MDLAVRERGSLLANLADAGVLTETSLDLRLAPRMTFDRYEELGAMLAQLGRSCRWWIGDWILFGEGTYSEKYPQALKATRLSEGTLLNYVSVCRRVTRGVRRIDVSFSVHSEVASLTPNEQRHWLAVAARENLTQRDLRLRLRAQSAPRGSDPEPGLERAISPPLAISVGPNGGRVVEDLASLLRSIVKQAVGDGNGRYVVPGELFVRLQEAVEGGAV